MVVPTHALELCPLVHGGAHARARAVVPLAHGGAHARARTVVTLVHRVAAQMECTTASWLRTEEERTAPAEERQARNQVYESTEGNVTQ